MGWIVKRTWPTITMSLWCGNAKQDWALSLHELTAISLFAWKQCSCICLGLVPLGTACGACCTTLCIRLDQLTLPHHYTGGLYCHQFARGRGLLGHHHIAVLWRILWNVFKFSFHIFSPPSFPFKVIWCSDIVNPAYLNHSCITSSSLKLRIQDSFSVMCQ